jgi:hypothetical protein
MRNDARPIGEASPASPVGGDATPGEGERRDGDPRKHDRWSDVVNRDLEEGQADDSGQSLKTE